jgi:hypothetical protein
MSVSLRSGALCVQEIRPLQNAVVAALLVARQQTYDQSTIEGQLGVSGWKRQARQTGLPVTSG